MAGGITYRQACSWLVGWARERGIIADEDARWAENRILEAVGEWGQGPVGVEAGDLTLDEALTVLAERAVQRGVVEDSAIGRDRAAMRAMGSVMARPSEVTAHFRSLYQGIGPKAATDWFYRLCEDVNYVRRGAIARNVSWVAPTPWGDLEITINKSKPEKDPKDIARAGAAPAGEAYPACQLCVENEGYSGRPADVGGGHPARQNLRIVPIELAGERWGFQYSPYAYFNEHCIVMSERHRPMHIDEVTLGCLLDFVELFPHYFVGSNADLPIVGGSILSHDHFQGGRHTFAMDVAAEIDPFALPGYADVACRVLRWPLTVIRLRGRRRESLLGAAGRVLDCWRTYDDVAAGIVSRDVDGTRHNTVTPICRRRGDAWEMDLALRCNVTSEEHPLGVFHPHEDKWHVKKENIGLIEVMGLAILPPRLEADLAAGTLTRDEIGRVFAGVLEDAGVFKWDSEGRAGMGRFVEALLAFGREA